jgi:hypothetical protein
MNQRTAFVRWTSLLAALILVLAACTLPTGTPTATAGTGLPRLDPAAITNFLNSAKPVVSIVKFPKFFLTPPAPATPSVNDLGNFSYNWAGSPVPFPVNQLTLFTQDCSQPVNVDSFSIDVTTNKATSFKHNWMVMTYVNNVQNNLVVGPATIATFASASTQTFVQDTPFSLTCGTYIVALGVDFGTTGGYLMESLVIQGTGTATPAIPAGSDIGDISGNTFYWTGLPIPFPVNQLTLITPDCNQPLSVDSFSIAVTTNKATVFEHGWMVMTYVNNVQNNLVVGPGTVSTFASASTQTFVQDTPFSLTCGTYIVALWVNFGATGGYLMESLVIESAASATQAATATTTATAMAFNPTSFLPQLILNLNANCHRGPGVNYDVVTYGLKGNAYPILGVNFDGTWDFVRFDANLDCWMDGAAGTPQGSTGGLPVVAAPTFTPVPAAGIDCTQFKTVDSCNAHPACTFGTSSSGGRSCVNR